MRPLFNASMLILFSCVYTGEIANASGWSCSAYDEDETFYSAFSKKGEEAMENAMIKCKNESPKPKTCKKLWPCIRMVGGNSSVEKAIPVAFQCSEVGPENSYTHVDPDIASRNAEANCQPHAGPGHACYSKGCVQIPNGNYTCTYSVYACQ